MPNTREKLIELLGKAHNATTDACFEKDLTYAEAREIEADVLIANGVTLAKDINVPIKWIPVTERLPDAWVDVLSCDRNKNLTVDCVDEKGKWYSEYKDLEEVTHWMPLPQPPKGE